MLLPGLKKNNLTGTGRSTAQTKRTNTSESPDLADPEKVTLICGHHGG